MIYRVLEENMNKFCSFMRIDPPVFSSFSLSSAVKILQSMDLRKAAYDSYQWAGRQITSFVRPVQSTPVQAVDEEKPNVGSVISPGFIPSEEPVLDNAKGFNAKYVRNCCEQAGLLEHFLVPIYFIEGPDSWSMGAEPVDRVRFKPEVTVTRLHVAKLCILGYLEKNSYIPYFLSLEQVVNGSTLQDLSSDFSKLTDEERSNLKRSLLSKEMEWLDSVRNFSESIASHARVLLDEPRFLEAFFDLPLPLPERPAIILEESSNACVWSSVRPCLADYPE